MQTATPAAPQPDAAGRPKRPPGTPGTNPTTSDWIGDRAELVRLAHRFVWSPDDAEDIVHDAILHARRNRHQLRDPARANPWLRRIVVQRALLHLRQTHRRRRALEAAGRAEPVPAIDPAQDAARREETQMLRAAIERLPTQQQIAVTLRHLEGMEYSRIAEIMDVAESTVRFHVRQARLALAASLEGAS
ncbi:MAG: RNA polymerase sigma factor [Phycisphaerales bacterium]|nr:MAG: RNA polymerase sigma factor [Phycisphaerales bacterium]